MRTVRLGDVAAIHGGGRLGFTGNDFISDGVPAYGAGGLNGYLPVAEHQRPGIVLSSVGARCGKCFLVEGAWASLANTQVILPDLDEIDPGFLWYQLNDEGRWPRSGTGQPFIKPSDVKAHRITLPSLSEQRRIAAILDQADALRTTRRQVLAHLDTLTQSVFQAMFGEMRATEPVAVIASNLRTGPFGSQLLHSEFVREGVAVLGLDNVVGNEFRWAERRYISEAKYQQLRRYTVAPGDVLISIMGTTGRCVVVPEGIPTAINTKHICAITPDPDLVDSQFLRGAFLWHPESRRHLRQQTKGSIMDGLNMGIIKAMPVPVPPLPLQREFAGKVAAINERRAAVERALALDEELFASLQSRAFRGDL